MPTSMWSAGIAPGNSRHTPHPCGPPVLFQTNPGMPTSLWAKKNPPSGGFFNDSKAHPCSDKRLQTDKKRSPVSGDRSGRALPLTQENQKLPTRSTTTSKTKTPLQQHKRINTIDTTQSHNAINNTQSIRHNRYCSIDTADLTQQQISDRISFPMVLATGDASEAQLLVITLLALTHKPSGSSQQSL